MVNSENTQQANELIAAQFAADIIETRLDWRIEDIKYFFKFFRQRKDIPECCIMGNRITADKLMQVVGAYEVERSNEKVMLIKKKYAEPNEPISPVAVGTNPVIQEIYSRLSPAPVEFTAKELSEDDKKINEIMREFDEIFKRQDDGKKGKRVIIYYGSVFDADQFVKYKLSKNNL